MATKRPRMTWRKQEKETGLSAIGAAPRGAVLTVDGQIAGRVYAKGGGAMHHGPFLGWYWVAGWDVPAVTYRNTVSESNPLPQDIEIAKAECKAYVLECLAKGGA